MITQHKKISTRSANEKVGSLVYQRLNALKDDLFTLTDISATLGHEAKTDLYNLGRELRYLE